MIKNLLATIGLVVVIREGYGIFRQYERIKAENEYFRAKIGR